MASDGSPASPRSTVRLSAGEVSVTVDPARGGRLASVQVAGKEFLVGAGVGTTDGADPMLWGAYPMVPFAGRVRDGRLTFDGRVHQLRLNAAPHSIHGTVFDAPWTPEDTGPTAVAMRCALGHHWPLGGTARHVVSVSPEGVRCELSVTATEVAMPAQVGWHPWFAPEARVQLRFAAMLVRDASGITTRQRAVPPTGPVDDCFVEPLEWPRIEIGDTVLEVRSDCSHWVVYDESAKGTCVEPQSGAPNGVNDDPVVLQPGETLTRWMELRRVT